MILQLIINIFLGAISIIFGWLPPVGSLPLGIDSALSTAMGWVYYLYYALWPMQIIIQVALYYVSFRLLLLVLKLFMGSRTPHHV